MILISVTLRTFVLKVLFFLRGVAHRNTGETEAGGMKFKANCVKLALATCISNKIRGLESGSVVESGLATLTEELGSFPNTYMVVYSHL